MNLTVTPGRLRRISACVWIVYAAWFAWFWAGLAGIGIVCVASTRLLRASWRRAACALHVQDGALRRAWVMPWAVCLTLDDDDHWVCRDELPPAQWAALLRFVRLNCPRQAVGWSLSS